jgi:hypothetical protein
MIACYSLLPEWSFDHDRTGWPWTVGITPVPPMKPEGSDWPRINIVTPSYKQVQFIDEKTIHPVLVQGNDLGLSPNQYDNNKQDY